MISIDNNFNIEASQYDTYTIRFKFKDYVLTGDDKFRFSIKATSNLRMWYFLRMCTTQGLIMWIYPLHLVNWTILRRIPMCMMWP